MENTGIINTQSQKLSFVQLIKDNAIVIPLIQRDYAQGRSSEKATKIRKDFVNELHTKIIENKPLSLDFVYGTIYDGKLIPLDGQQRLTTLFLLHIYLEGVTRNKILNYRFTYETRDSSRRFCDEIISHRLQIFNPEELTKEIPTGNKDEKILQTPSMIIRNQNWWFGIWDSDPTISGMLNMLDEIHHIFFNDAEQAYRTLFAQDSQAVTFRFMPLKDFYDPDDLYMKMNARGLPLTPFEIFKSRFYSDVEKNLSPDEVKNAKSDIDVKYTDFLWPQRQKDMKNIDTYLQRIFKLIIVANHVSLSKALDKEWLDYLFEANNKTYLFAHNQYAMMGVAFTPGLIERLLTDLSLLCSDSSPFHLLRNEEGILINAADLWNELIINGEQPTYRQRLELYALLRLFATFRHLNSTHIATWTRLIHNLIEASGLDSSDRMAMSIRDVDTMIQSLQKYNNATDVNDWVASTPDIRLHHLPQYQWQEEVVKARLRKDPCWDKEIHRAENHPYLNGEIAVTLWLAGVIKDDGTPAAPCSNKRITYHNYLDKALPLFDEIGRADSTSVKEHLMVRAMLNMDDYMPWSTSNRKNIYNRPGHRDYSWKTLFRVSHDTNITALKCLKQILDDKNYDCNDIPNSLETIGSQKLGSDEPLWRRLLTSPKAHLILSNSHQGFIAFIGDQDNYNDRNILIYGKSQRNGNHAELYTLYLYYVLKDLGIETSYNDVSDSYSDYSLTFQNSQGDEIQICYWDGEWYNNQNTFYNIHSLKKFILK